MCQSGDKSRNQSGNRICEWYGRSKEGRTSKKLYGETRTGYCASKVDRAGRNIARDAGKRRRIVKTVYPGIFESDSRDGRRTVLCG